MSEWSGILVYVEMIEAEIQDVSIQLIWEAARLAEKTGEKVFAAAVCKDERQMKEKLAGLPVETVYIYETTQEFEAKLYEKALTECILKVRPATVLIGGTGRGRALAPRIAVAFRTGLTADCTQLEINEENHLVQTRPAFGGNIMASILTEKSRPQIATVRPGVFPVGSVKKRESDVEFIVEPFLDQSKETRFIGKMPIQKTSGIETAQILVAAGRGVKRKEDLEMLRELAAALGGKLASSRALVEKGWMKPEEQIGLSGNTVQPKCLITFGISGTVQFVAGMKNTPNIIAVNTDPEAKIFDIAHYSICADLYEVVPRMLKDDRLFTEELYKSKEI